MVNGVSDITTPANSTGTLRGRTHLQTVGDTGQSSLLGFGILFSDRLVLDGKLEGLVCVIAGCFALGFRDGVVHGIANRKAFFVLLAGWWPRWRGDIRQIGSTIDFWLGHGWRIGINAIDSWIGRFVVLGLWSLVTSLVGRGILS